MPLVKIHTLKGKDDAVKKAIMDGVHRALVSAFKIPESDKTIFLSEYDEGNVGGKNGNFTLIEIIAFSGRSKDAKKQLYREIVENVCAAVAFKPADLFIIVNDLPLENWGIRGGQMASEINLGFKLDI